ncbi:hypothetical protein AOXY_G8530 [Acipenser oxyrinchus oxyrinchus]|uniref:Uncharacterized protein n=1 Tax=Acipenser oxyrinchus oxyrinchus TaxID=40147 RepID=A0AAD8DI46_ACIOX|nr:hypothetical protein AOXY_G8530 [Acipenser oxyrinchus oxyrinchus]
MFSYYDGNVQVWLGASEPSNDEFKPLECKHICIVEVEPEKEQEAEETMINYESVNQISCEISHANTAETSVVSDNPKTEEKANFELNENMYVTW